MSARGTVEFTPGGARRGLRRNSFGSATLGAARKAARFSPQELAAQRWLESLAVRKLPDLGMPLPFSPPAHCTAHATYYSHLDG